MFVFRVNQKGEAKRAFSSFLNSLAEMDWSGAYDHISVVEEKLCQYLLVKGDPSLIPEVREVCRRIKLYLREPRMSEDKRRLIFSLIENLKKMFEKNANSFKDSYHALLRVYTDLRDDWSEFWQNPSEANLSSLRDDLDDLESLEPLFRGEPDDKYKQYREVLKKRSKCYTMFPYMTGMAVRGLIPSDSQRKQIFDSFSELFSAIEPLLAPYRFEYVKEIEEKPGRIRIEGV